MRHKIIMCFFIVIVILSLQINSFAAVPRVINYQGKLTTSAGAKSATVITR